MEGRDEFPRRYRPGHCVVCDLTEVEAWLADREQQAGSDPVEGPDVGLTRPVR